MVKCIGEKFPIPIEVMPFAWQLVKRQLEDLGGQGELRQSSNGLAVSSYGSLILDMAFPVSIDGSQLDVMLNNMPGVVEHGIFRDLASVVLLAEKGNVNEIIAIAT